MFPSVVSFLQYPKLVLISSTVGITYFNLDKLTALLYNAQMLFYFWERL